MMRVQLIAVLFIFAALGSPVRAQEIDRAEVPKLGFIAIRFLQCAATAEVGGFSDRARSLHFRGFYGARLVARYLNDELNALKDPLPPMLDTSRVPDVAKFIEIPGGGNYHVFPSEFKAYADSFSVDFMLGRLFSAFHSIALREVDKTRTTPPASLNQDIFARLDWHSRERKAAAMRYYESLNCPVFE